MGGKLSTEKYCRASVVTPTYTHAEFAFNYNGDNNNNNNNDFGNNDFGNINNWDDDALQSGYLPPRNKVNKHNTNRIIAFHAKNSWSAYIEASKTMNNLVVINFTNSWYEPCRYMEGVFNGFASDYTNVEFIKIDVDELFEISRHYGVRTAPTYLFMKKGKEIDRVVGARKEELQTKIEKHINN